MVKLLALDSDLALAIVAYYKSLRDETPFLEVVMPATWASVYAAGNLPLWHVIYHAAHEALWGTPKQEPEAPSILNLRSTLGWLINSKDSSWF